MLNIQVTDDYKLTSDGMQILVQRRHIIDPSLAPAHKRNENAEIREEWKTWKYCGKVEQAVDLILKQKIMESNAASLKELIQEIKDFEEYVKNLLH